METISHDATGQTWPSILSVMNEPHWQFNYERTHRSQRSRPESGHVLHSERYDWPTTRPCLRCFPAQKKSHWRFARHARAGMLRCTGRFVKKKHSDLFGSYLPVSLSNRYVQALWARGGRHQLFTVCVFFNNATTVTCQRPHKLANPTGFVRLLRAERLIVLMGWNESESLCLSKDALKKLVHFLIRC